MRPVHQLPPPATERAATEAPRRRPISWRDGALAAFVVLAHLAPVRTGQPKADPSAVVVAVGQLLALGSGVALLFRRSHPRAATAVVLVSFAGLALAQGLVPPYAAWVLIWSLAVSGRDRRASVVLAAGAAGLTIVLLVGGELSRNGNGALGLLVTITLLITLAAWLVRSERGRIEAVGRRAATDERMRIARDLHDLVGHGLSTIAVQSSTARMALAVGDADTAGRALTAVESSSRVAMREMRQMLGVLIDDGASVVFPSPGLADLAALVENVRAGGVTVALEQNEGWGAAPAAVQLCAYRIVQEGLTNAVKHSPGANVQVRLDTDTGDGADGGSVSVETTAAAAPYAVSPPRAPSGDADRAKSAGERLGLEGLRTRVDAVGGTLESGPTPSGWLLRAWLPWTEGDA